MKIPNKIKIGGKRYSVKQTEYLSLGDDYVGECLYQDLEIHIRPTKSHTVQEITFLHEMLHAIYNHLGYSDHDEKKIDELANALHMVIVDNPDVFKSKD